MTKKRIFFQLNLIVLILVIDRLIKLWALNTLAQSSSVIMFAGLIELRYAENTGMAFSFLNSSPMILTCINTLIVAALIIWAIKTNNLKSGISFIIAGGIGNLIDRFSYGFVVDFINPTFVKFAIFNVADIALNIGVGLILLETLRKKEVSKFG